MSTKLSDGALARRGLLDGEALAAAEDLLARTASSELETVRVVFVDQHGILRGKTIVAGALGSAFSSGMAAPSTLLLKDTSHRTVFPVWGPDAGIASGPMQGANDILLVPDATSFRQLPWSPHSAWLFCEPRHRSGDEIPFTPLTVLRRATGRLADRGLSALMGLEVEFHVFEPLEQAREHPDTTMPGRAPRTRALAQGYQYLTETRYGECEALLDTIRRHCQALGLPVRSVEIEMGPSQFEFTFDPAPPMQQAANMAMFRAAVKEICAAQGLLASFMPKPRAANACASGWHIHQSLSGADGRNVFAPEAERALTPQAEGWIAGLLDHAAESGLLTGPTVNSYKRFGSYQLAPNRVAWGWDNRGAMVRALMAPGDPASRVENRIADPSANPYYAFAAQIVSGLSGLDAARRAPAPTETPYDDAAAPLPATLGEAIAAFDGSALYRDAFGPETVDYLVTLKRAEWDRYLSVISEWEQDEYLTLF